MILMLRSKISIIVIMLLVLASCSEDTTEPTDEKDYFPLSKGNYWIYNVYELDANSNPIDLIGTDSIIVSAITEINDKNGYELLVFRNKVIFDTLYYYTKDNSIYQYLDESTDSIPGLSEWFEIINTGGDTWFIHQEESEEYEISFDDSTVTTNAFFVYNGKYHGPQKISIEDKEYQTIHTSYKADTKKEFEYIFSGDTSKVEIIHARNMDFYVSDAIGIVIQTLRPGNTIIKTSNQSPYYPQKTYEHNGLKRELIRYMIR